jgi:hypothetical protein
VNEFVAECRSEWRRLGVADPAADEMAADLAADLAEAESEGVPLEEVLGSAAFDPRSFAAAWAAERGLVRRAESPERGLLRKSLSAALAAFALLAVVGAVVVIVAPRSDEGRLSLPARFPAPTARPVIVVPQEAPLRIWVTSPNLSDDSGIDTRTVGWILLAVGLAGAVPLTVSRLWLGGGWPHRRTPTFG